MPTSNIISDIDLTGNNYLHFIMGSEIFDDKVVIRYVQTLQFVCYGVVRENC